MTRHARKVPPLGLVLEQGRLPLHKQIGEQIRRAILERRLAPGLKLPSSRLMAGELNVARGTILMAMDQLIAEGYVAAQAGSGLSVATDLPDEMLISPSVDAPRDVPTVSAPVLSRRTIKSLANEPSDMALDDSPIAFPTGQPDRSAFPFPLWAKLLEQEWRKPAWQVAGAPHPFGHHGLRAAIAAYLGMARGFGCEARAVVITSGVRQSLSALARIILDVGDAAWIEEPGFIGTREALAMAEVRAVAVPVDALGFSLDRALRLAPNARLAVVAPSHQFPLGTVMSLQRRLELLSWAERTRSWIAEDDFDGEYRYSGRPLAPLRALDRSGRVAYLGSFSKLLPCTAPELSRRQRCRHRTLTAAHPLPLSRRRAPSPATRRVLGEQGRMKIVAIEVRLTAAVPLMTSLASCGFPSPAEDHVDWALDFNELLIENPPATIIVRVKGDSMIEIGILPGDLAVVNRAIEAVDR